MYNDIHSNNCTIIVVRVNFTHPANYLINLIDVYIKKHTDVRVAPKNILALAVSLFDKILGAIEMAIFHEFLR